MTTIQRTKTAAIDSIKFALGLWFITLAGPLMLPIAVHSATRDFDAKDILVILVPLSGTISWFLILLDTKSVEFAVGSIVFMVLLGYFAEFANHIGFQRL